MTLRLALVSEFDLFQAANAAKRSSARLFRFRADNGPFGGNSQGLTDHFAPSTQAAAAHSAGEHGRIKTFPTLQPIHIA